MISAFGVEHPYLVSKMNPVNTGRVARNADRLARMKRSTDPAVRSKGALQMSRWQRGIQRNEQAEGAKYAARMGEPVKKDFGDKAKTGAMGVGGAIVGSQIGSIAGAHAGGSTYGNVMRGVREFQSDPAKMARVHQTAQRASAYRVSQGKSPAQFRTSFMASRRAAGRAIPGFKAAARGSGIGAAVGGGLALAGMALHHSNKNKQPQIG